MTANRDDKMLWVFPLAGCGAALTLVMAEKVWYLCSFICWTHLDYKVVTCCNYCNYGLTSCWVLKVSSRSPAKDFVVLNSCWLYTYFHVLTCTPANFQIKTNKNLRLKVKSHLEHTWHLTKKLYSFAIHRNAANKPTNDRTRHNKHVCPFACSTGGARASAIAFPANSISSSHAHLDEMHATFDLISIVRTCCARLLSRARSTGNAINAPPSHRPSPPPGAEDGSHA